VSGRQELGLETHRELGTDLVKDLFNCTGVLNQRGDRTQQKLFHAEEPINSAGQARGRVSGFQYGRPNRGGIKREEF
jgi:hypothetical protein